MKDMLQPRVIRPRNSPFSSLVILVKKKDRGWCMCIDYRVSNAIIVRDCFSIPTIDELLGELNGATMFSKLDLHSGYGVLHPPWSF